VISGSVIRPLNLSTLNLVDPRRVSRPYHRRGADHDYIPIRDTDATTFATRPNPAYGGFSTVGDLGRLYEHLLRCSTDGGLVRREAMRRLLRTEAQVKFRAGDPPLPIGLGFFLGGSAAGFGSEWAADSFGHMGSIWAYYSTVALCDPTTRTVVAARFSSVGLANNAVLAALGRALHIDLGRSVW
jgi:hypothetical protein